MEETGGFLKSIREASNLAFAHAWLGWRGDRLLPPRTAMDLNSIRRLLPAIMLFEVPCPEVSLVKVAGTWLREHFGYELTGRNYVELAPPGRQAIRRYRMWQSVTRPCGSRLVREHKLPTGRVSLAEVVTLPLDADRAAGPRQLVTHFAPFSQHYESGAAPEPGTFDVAGNFAFLDIGSGIPDGVVPPAHGPG